VVVDMTGSTVQASEDAVTDKAEGSEPTQACGDDTQPGQEDWYQTPR